MYSVIANMKMYLSWSEGQSYMLRLLSQDIFWNKLEFLIAPSFPLLPLTKNLIGEKPIGLSAQNLCVENSGAFTGEVSACMLQEIGCTHVLIGHSERRQYYGENDEDVRKKTILAIQYGIQPVICIGENREVYENHRTREIIKNQLEAVKDLNPLWIAYEPVWSIGSGRVPAAGEIEEIVGFIRSQHDVQRVLYGGSVSLQNYSSLLSAKGIDGFLVGGLSIKLTEFSQFLYELSAL